MESIDRRTFVKTVGVGVAAATLPPLASPASANAVDRGRGEYSLATPYFKISGGFGKFTELAFDPTGRGQYESPTFNQVHLGDFDGFNERLNGDVAWSATNDKLRLSGINVTRSDDILQHQSNTPYMLQPGGSLGQSFTVMADVFGRVGVNVPTWRSTTSGFTLTLYSGEPGGTLEKVASERYDNVVDGAWVYLRFPVQPGGKFYLEMSEPEPLGKVGWWGQDGQTTVDVGGTGYVNREARENLTMRMEVYGRSVESIASWELKANGPRLTSTYTLSGVDSGATDPGLTLVTPWLKSGYSLAHVDGVLFRRFFTDHGRYITMHQLKRRDAWERTVDFPRWIQATGTGTYDLRIAGTNMVLDGKMTDSAMTMRLNAASAKPAQTVTQSLAVDVIPHTEAVPDFFPAFVASNELRSAQLTEFLLERAFSYPFNSHPADWKDWMGRVLDWTDTGGSAGEGISLLGIKQDEDGYIHSWDDARGWPFPDRKQYDTRHFTTNAMYVLGAWRHYSWTGDEAFLDAIMPRVRLALEFYLDRLGGRTGVVTIDSPDHTGRVGSLGSSYWDGLATGYLDSYTNAYFYGALDAAAQLENHLGNTGRARELRALRPIVRAKYNELFWNDEDGRYIQTIDVDGVRHDFGATFVNLEAASFGLPSTEQASRIFDWLERGHTKVRDHSLVVPAGGTAPLLSAEHSFGQTFIADKAFVTVAAFFATYRVRGAEFAMTLHRLGPTGPVVASGRFTDWGDGGVAHLDMAEQPPGTYYLEMSEAKGTIAWWSGTEQRADVRAFTDGAPATDVATRAMVLLGPLHDGPADIYSRWGFTPRTTTIRNEFWNAHGQTHLYKDWGGEVQDGGANLYISGFDVLARARYRSADDAWQRLTAILDRWAEPDHLCGGAPLYRGEDAASDGGGGGGGVGTDVPFPESGFAPASVIYAFLGVEAQPDELTITPNLPSELPRAGVNNMLWRGRRVNLMVSRNTIELRGEGISKRRKYTPGETVRIRAPRALSSGR